TACPKAVLPVAGGARPAGARDGPRPQPLPLARDGSTMNPVPPTGKTVLVVEDHEMEREGVAAVLQPAAYAVLMTASVQAALDYLQRSPRPDVILLDMLMQGPDGWDFMQVRRHDATLAGIPVVITTASTTVTEEW